MASPSLISVYQVTEVPVLVISAVGLILLTEVIIRTRIYMSTTTTTNPNGAGRNSNPIKNMTLIQALTALVFCFFQLMVIKMEAPWLVFPHLLLGLPSAFMFVVFFLLNEGARSYAWRRLSRWKEEWVQVAMLCI